jgi:hypothetical protein
MNAIRLTVFSVLVFSLSVFADLSDTIIMKDGEEIIGNIVEISNDNVKYKRMDNPAGPMFILSKNSIFMIKYKNGTKDVFNEKLPAVQHEIKTEIQNTLVIPNDTILQTSRSPGLALLLSALVPGIGQAYNREYLPKGLFQSALAGTGILFMTALGWSTESEYYSRWDTWDEEYDYTYYYYKEPNAFFWIGMGATLGGYVWSVIDAPVSAARKNRASGSSISTDRKHFKISPLISADHGTTRYGIRCVIPL